MKRLFLVLLGSYSMLACAETPLFSIVPQGTQPTRVTPDGTADLLYTVTNNTPYTLEDLGLNYQPTGQTPLSVTQNTGTTNTPPTCANPFSLLPGGSCTLDLTVTGANVKGGGAFGGPEVCFNSVTPSRCSVPSAGNQINVSLFTISNTNLSLAVGVTNTGDQLFTQSLDQGVSWKLSNLPNTLPSIFAFSSPSCNVDICVVVTGLPQQVFGTFQNMLHTLDEGQTWIDTSVTSYGYYIGTACTQDGLGMCFLWTTDSTHDDFLSIQYTAAAPEWTTVTVLSSVGFSNITNPSCGSNVCVAGGGVAPATPYLFQIQNPGSASSNWGQVTNFVSGPLPSSTGFTAGSCDGDLCVYFGVNNITKSAFTVRTADGGNTWTYRDLQPVTIAALSVSCNESTSICAAIGARSSTLAYILTSLDGGLTWSDVTPAPLNSGTFQDQGQVSCSSSLCVAWGLSLVSGHYNFYIYQSIAGGSWTAVAIPGVALTDQIQTVQCNDQYCIIGGEYQSSLAPLLAQSTNGGVSWATYDLTTVPNLSTSGLFLGVSAGSLPNPFFKSEMDFFKHKGLR